MRYPARTLAGFSALTFPIYACQIPLGVYLPPIYSQHFGVPLALLGTILLVEKLWGAAADPLIGALSDRTRSAFGRRRPWIVAGAGLFAISGFMLFFPPNPFPPALLGVGLFLFYPSVSMLQIPYLAWSGELTRDYHERTRIVTYQAVATAGALLAVLLLPALIDRIHPRDAALKLGSMGAFILVSLLPAVILTLRSMPEPPSPQGAQPRQSVLQAFRLIARDALLVRVLLADLAVSFGQYTRGALFVFLSPHTWRYRNGRALCFWCSSFLVSPRRPFGTACRGASANTARPLLAS